MRRPVVLGLCALTVACAPTSDKTTINAPAPLSATERESVKAVDPAFAAGMNAKDALAVFAVYADDAKVMPPESPILEGTAAHPAITGLVAGGAGDFVLTPTTDHGIGDLAYLMGTASFTMGGVS